ncbi:YbjN domain-containing protein [Sphingobacterium hungaricum]|uniref:Molecular chaperone Tir n=1 Tax=Sphingobacterium hungaricum TaxID=2082723 RepID=A0A928UXX2_9SPHI|nr:YbjN domain-containing protein [Sphingobacterium hungaricum]MBE8713481.1 molecular chaperone Tir [Sphingobacterium hungaricum]
MNFQKVENFITDLDFLIVSKDENEGVFVIENESDGIRNLIIGVADPIIIFEQYLFTLSTDSQEIFKSLLIKNRDIVHGAFALTEDGKKVIFRYTLQIHNLDKNEFEAAINSLSLLMSEYYEQLIDFSKK